MKISNIEEHSISLALNDAPKSNCEKVLPTSKKCRNKLCILNTFKFIHYPLFSTRHISSLDDAAHNMCSTYRKKNFRASSFRIYQ